MLRSLIILLSALLLGGVGFWFGYVIHGLTVQAAVPALAGAAGGLGIGCAGLYVVQLWRSRRLRTGA
jgi:hypothetical protein